MSDNLAAARKELEKALGSPGVAAIENPALRRVSAYALLDIAESLRMLRPPPTPGPVPAFSFAGRTVRPILKEVGADNE
ncbi:MAG: hypothetical protein CK431_10225 [Mycobacterium sp.]|nr:MAG: hypothetical protein CK431_10225 [Mycobacterium sp.]